MSNVFFSLAISAALCFALPFGAVRAETTNADAATVLPERIARLVQTMQIDDMLVVMQDEGVAYGKTLDDEMLGGRAGAGWPKELAAIYDPKKLRQHVEEVMLKEYARDTATLGEVETFFGSPEGQKILGLEVAARRKMLDTAAKDAAEVDVQKMIDERNPRMELLRQFAQVNDLLEMNVAGAMSSNLSFYKGLAAEGAFDKALTEDEMLSDVWAQEPQVRKDSETWLYAFLSLAYAPLSDKDLESYITFSQTAAGQRVNSILFAAFDETFRQVSFELGRAAALQMKGSDI